MVAEPEWAIRRVGEIIDELDLKGQNEELIKELVLLSTRHGILTPYTSFLADENVSLGELSQNAAAAKEQLGQLHDTGGRSGFVQRRAKGEYQRARNAAEAPKSAAGRPASARMLPAGAAPARKADRSGGSFGGSRATSPAVAGDAAGLAEAGDEPVRNVGTKSFFRRGARWIDSTVSEEQEKKARRVAQFSDDYFKLADRHGRKLSQYLVFDEPVLLELDGETYLIEPAE